MLPRPPDVGHSASPVAPSQSQMKLVANMQHDQDGTRFSSYEKYICLYGYLGNIKPLLDNMTDIISKEIRDVKKHIAELITLQYHPKTYTESRPRSRVPSSNGPAAALDSSTRDKILNETETMREELTQMRASFSEFSQLLAHSMTAVEKRISAIPQTPETTKRPLELEKNRMEETTTNAQSRTEELSATLSQMKIDVIQRRTRPPANRMNQILQKAMKLRIDVTNAQNTIVELKPVWKKTWESELERIVKEQKALNDSRQILADLEEDVNGLVEIFTQLQAFCDLQSQRGAVPLQLPSYSDRPVGEHMGDVILAITSSVDSDPVRRLKALAEAEEVRKRERAERMIEEKTDFENELNNFIQSRRLRKTGGVGELERRRSKIEEAVLKSLVTSRTGAVK